MIPAACPKSALARVASISEELHTAAAQGVTKIVPAPANIDAALTWLQYCQLFDLSEAVPVRCWSATGRANAPLLCMNRLLHAGRTVQAMSEQPHVPGKGPHIT